MKTTSTRRVLMAGLLTLIFILPHVVKSAHLLRHEHLCRTHLRSSAADKQHPVHDCTTCPICNYLFACFTETCPGPEIRTPQRSHFRLHAEYDSSIRIPFFTSHPSRAPPV